MGILIYVTDKVFDGIVKANVITDFTGILVRVLQKKDLNRRCISRIGSWDYRGWHIWKSVGQPSRLETQGRISVIVLVDSFFQQTLSNFAQKIFN